MHSDYCKTEQMKTVVNLFIVTFFCVIIYGCHHSNLNSQLVFIDSLLLNELPDSAYSILKRVNKEKLDEENLAYYHLLLAQSQYKTYIPITSDSVISLALNYYLNMDDKNKLARAYYYKGCILDDLKRHKEGMENMKKAESVAKGSHDYVLLHNIAFYIGAINLTDNENKLALMNFMQALDYSKKTQKSNHLLFDYERLAICYRRLGEKDSAASYVDSIFQYINNLPKSQQISLSSTYTVLGNNFFDIDAQKAEELYKKAISIKPTGSAYGSLARIKHREGNLKEARELAHKGIITSENGNIKYAIIRTLSDIEKSSGNYKLANELSQQALQIKDSLTTRQQNDNVKAVQIEYDSEEMENRKNRQLYGTLCALALVVIIGGSVSLWLRKRKKEAERLAGIKAKENEVLVQNNEQLSEEKRQSDRELQSVNRKLAIAEKKLKEWEARQKEAQKGQKATDAALANGHRLFHELMEGGTTVLWKRQDFTNFFDFYCQIDSEFREKVGQSYSHLTPNAQVMVVLQHLGMTDEELCERMNLTRAALRTMKWRIKTASEN